MLVSFAIHEVVSCNLNILFQVRICLNECRQCLHEVLLTRADLSFVAVEELIKFVELREAGEVSIYLLFTKLRSITLVLPIQRHIHFRVYRITVLVQLLLHIRRNSNGLIHHRTSVIGILLGCDKAVLSIREQCKYSVRNKENSLCICRLIKETIVLCLSLRIGCLHITAVQILSTYCSGSGKFDRCSRNQTVTLKQEEYVPQCCKDLSYLTVCSCCQIIPSVCSQR